MNVPSDTPAARPSRRWAALAAVLAVVAAALVVLALTTGGSGDDPAGAAASSGSATATATPAAPSAAPAPVALAPAADTPEPTGPTTDADEPPVSLDPVPLDQPAAVGNGVTAEVVSLDAVDATGVGPGNVTGPALRVTVALTNGTADELSLGGVAVDLAAGPELVPASPVNDPAAAPFSGTVPAGGTARGVYVFSIAAADRADLTLSVGYEAGAPILVFTGAAS
ncbi:hypothetical protein [Modestobacter altitudinis]|uniref:hypothetical protein n=1 Tax=Modestobacter altitudinis TaxID=2213158 RepID=UPI00110CBE7E|nr:hypothetical protein [Modestobacter altitudinis]